MPTILEIFDFWNNFKVNDRLPLIIIANFETVFHIEAIGDNSQKNCTESIFYGLQLKNNSRKVWQKYVLPLLLYI